jgi:hypothetical protein
MAIDINPTDLIEVLGKLQENSDKVRLHLDKADKEMSITPIIKASKE